MQVINWREKLEYMCIITFSDPEYTQKSYPIKNGCIPVHFTKGDKWSVSPSPPQKCCLKPLSGTAKKYQYMSTRLVKIKCTPTMMLWKERWATGISSHCCLLWKTIKRLWGKKTFGRVLGVFVHFFVLVFTYLNMCIPYGQIILHCRHLFKTRKTHVHTNHVMRLL